MTQRKTTNRVESRRHLLDSPHNNDVLGGPCQHAHVPPLLAAQVGAAGSACIQMPRGQRAEEGTVLVVLRGGAAVVGFH